MEQINLNMIPNGVLPVCHVSQYDAGRQIKINLFDGNTPHTILNTEVYYLDVRKPDNTIVRKELDAFAATPSNTYVTIETTQRMTAVFGDNICELTIANYEGRTGSVASLNFIMQVEPDVLADGDPSQSEIDDLPDMVDALLTPYKYKDYTGTLTAGSTTLSIWSDANDPLFTVNSTFDFYTSVYGVNPVDVELVELYVEPNSYVEARFTFEAQAQDIGVKVRVYQ